MKKVLIFILAFQSMNLFAQRPQLPPGFSMMDAMSCRKEIKKVGCGLPKKDPEKFKECIKNKGYSHPSDFLSEKCQDFISSFINFNNNEIESEISFNKIDEISLNKVFFETLSDMTTQQNESKRICKNLNFSKEQKNLIREKIINAKNARKSAKHEIKSLIKDHIQVLLNEESSRAEAKITSRLIQEKAISNINSFSNNRLDILYNVFEPKQRILFINCMMDKIKNKIIKTISKRGKKIYSPE